MKKESGDSFFLSWDYFFITSDGLPTDYLTHTVDRFTKSIICAIDISICNSNYILIGFLDNNLKDLNIDNPIINIDLY